MSAIEEVDAAFGSCWMKHEEKLKQCLDLRKFEEVSILPDVLLQIMQVKCISNYHFKSKIKLR